jgi:uncharacterized protein YbjT (DUF2867 family)
MYVVTGASGQIGSAVANELLRRGKAVKAVVRNPQKISGTDPAGLLPAIADLFDVKALKKAFAGGDTVFLLTPENPTSSDIIGDTEQILKNYREAVQYAGVKKIVGLSSIGAQHSAGTGNLVMSYMLEHAFQDLSVKKVFIRPSYYYSNWMMYAASLKESDVLFNFFPSDLSIPMVAPPDVAEFIAKVMCDDAVEDGRVYELVGPVDYTAADVASVFSSLLHRKIDAQQMPRNTWKETLLQVGFSGHAAANLVDMTNAVIERKAVPERRDPIRLTTPLEEYLRKNFKDR